MLLSLFNNFGCSVDGMNNKLIYVCSWVYRYVNICTFRLGFILGQDIPTLLASNCRRFAKVSDSQRDFFNAKAVQQRCDKMGGSGCSMEAISSQSDYVQLFLPGQQHWRPPSRVASTVGLLVFAINSNYKWQTKTQKWATSVSPMPGIGQTFNYLDEDAKVARFFTQFRLQFWFSVLGRDRQRWGCLSLPSKGKFNYAVAVIVYAARCCCCCSSLVL